MSDSNLDELLGTLAVVDTLLTAAKITPQTLSKLEEYHEACQTSGKAKPDLEPEQLAAAKDVFRVVNNGIGGAAALVTEGGSLPLTVAAGIAMKHSKTVQREVANALGSVVKSLKEAKESGKLTAECVDLHEASDPLTFARLFESELRKGDTSWFAEVNAQKELSGLTANGNAKAAL